MPSPLPNLFIVGAAKSGTTSLAKSLNKHPEIFISGSKEPAYYVEDAGFSDWSEYIALYKNAVGFKIICDASTGYLYEKHAPQRIFNNHPNSKILIVLRNPVKMAYAYWKYMHIEGNESLPFEETLSDQVVAYRKSHKFKEECKNWWASYLYLERAKYYCQVKRYVKQFGVKNVKIVIFEELIANPREKIKEILSFLDVREDIDIDLEKDNVGGELRFRWLRDYIYLREYPLLRKLLPPKIREIARAIVRDMNKKKGRHDGLRHDLEIKLYTYFEDDVAKLENLIGRNLDIWKQPSCSKEHK
ncbi:MAG: sulfotransferase domain-containing protein [Proteobacteria bacterium]|nr:sulfotransferase domain-containing protein [Pseudomonadota bacterium]